MAFRYAFVFVLVLTCDCCLTVVSSFDNMIRRGVLVKELEDARSQVETRRRSTQQTVRKFPCPACRSELQQDQLALEDYKMFTRLLEAAIEAESMSS